MQTAMEVRSRPETDITYDAAFAQVRGFLVSVRYGVSRQ